MDTEVYKKSKEFLQTEGMQKIMVSTDFYFQKARDAFNKFMKYDNRRLIEEIIDWTYNKQRYSDQNDVQELLGLIDNLVAYCDVHAFNKAKLNEYEDKRVLARSNIRQNAWIKQLLLYKLDRNKCTPAILNTVNYILKPETNINILSEEHRFIISQLLLKKDYVHDHFVSDVCDFFKELDIQVSNPLNKTCRY